MKTMLCFLFCLLTASAYSADLEQAALCILSGRERADCSFIARGDAGRVATTVTGITMAQVRAITNRADVLALAAAWDDAETAPRREPTGIEAPVIVLTAQTNGTPAWGVVADSKGALIVYQDHASPRTNAVANTKKQAAIDEVATFRRELEAGNPSVARRLEIVERMLKLR